MADCIFCKIISKEQSCDIVHESQELMAFKDINPKAPVHILIVPKKHIATVNDLADADKELIGDMVLEAKNIAKDQGIDAGYKLMFNVGRVGGQIIDHMHLHIMGGWQ